MLTSAKLSLSAGVRIPLNMSIESAAMIWRVWVFLDKKMTFLTHIETNISKSTRTLGFIKHLSRELKDFYVLKTLFVSLVRPNLE
jgi:hypothetical protein